MKAGACWVAVLRGGSWVSNPAYLRGALRARRPVDLHENGTGFRSAMTL
jgi:formylglycine-generating enzyme required for sulfatase activity